YNCLSRKRQVQQKFPATTTVTGKTAPGRPPATPGPLAALPHRGQGAARLPLLLFLPQPGPQLILPPLLRAQPRQERIVVPCGDHTRQARLRLPLLQRVDSPRHPPSPLRAVEFVADPPLVERAPDAVEALTHLLGVICGHTPPARQPYLSRPDMFRGSWPRRGGPREESSKRESPRPRWSGAQWPVSGAGDGRVHRVSGVLPLANDLPAGRLQQLLGGGDGAGGGVVGVHRDGGLPLADDPAAEVVDWGLLTVLTDAVAGHLPLDHRHAAVVARHDVRRDRDRGHVAVGVGELLVHDPVLPVGPWGCSPGRWSGARLSCLGGAAAGAAPVLLATPVG